MSKENLSRLTIAISKDLSCLNSKHLPNKETLKSVENIKKGKSLTEIDDLRDLFKKIGHIKR